MEFGSNSLSSSSPSSSNSSPQYKSSLLAPSSIVFDAAVSVGPDTKLELSFHPNDGVSAATTATPRPQPPSSGEKEHMFDKVVTPSDVGKLNRLVIPKQHAEKYFPLDSASNEKGFLLNFEDRGGKQWRFRYSYWNSSQSYVMTKGWSRFVKEKKLDAGDVVSFHRDTTDRERLFIDWRRRPDAPSQQHAAAAAAAAASSAYRSMAWGSGLMRPPGPHYHHMQYFPPPSHHHQPQPNFYSYNYAGLTPYRSSFIHGGGGFAFGGIIGSPAGPAFYLRSAAEEGMAAAARQNHQAVVFDSVPVVHGNPGEEEEASGKRVRLFGVNLECPTSDNNNHGEEEQEFEMLTNSASGSNNNSRGDGNDPLNLGLRYNNSTSSTTTTPIPGISTVDFLNKGKASSMTTFNFEI